MESPKRVPDVELSARVVQLRQLLERSEPCLQALAEELRPAPHRLLLTDRDGIALWSRAHELPPEEMPLPPGTDCAALLGSSPGTRPPALARAAPFRRELAGRVIVGQPVAVEGVGPVGALVASFESDPAPGVLALLRLTARTVGRLAGAAPARAALGEEHREWLAEIIHHVPAAVAVLDSQSGRAVMVNRHAEELFGTSLAEAGVVSLIGSPHFNPRQPDGRPLPAEEYPVLVALRTGRAVSGQELVLEVAGGRQATVLVSAVPILERGSVAALVVTLVDVTDRERILAAEREARARAEQSGRVRDRMVAALGHDLRQPLSAVLLGLDALEADPSLPASPRGLVRKTRRSARRIEAIISDLVDFGCSASGAPVRLAASEADLRGIAESVVEELQVVDPALRVDLRATGDVRGYWDEGRLAQVLTNLLVNAARYGEAGAPVELWLNGLGEAVVAEVRNRGEPIPPEVQQRLFQPFVRASRKGPGMGLGLFIVREIVRAHGGSVALSSTDADGTIVTVSLPRRPAELAPP